MESDFGAVFAPSLNGKSLDPDMPGVFNADTELLLDINALKLSPDALDGIGVRKVVTTVPVRPPHRQLWIRTHPDPEWRLDVLLLQLKDSDREAYIVSPALFDVVADEAAPTRLYSAMSRSGVFFLWPVRLPASDGRLDAWSKSAHLAAERAMARWTRVASNRALGAYEVYEAATGLAIPDPAWPTDADFRKLLSIAFRDRFISTEEHPVFRQLQGRL